MENDFYQDQTLLASTSQDIQPAQDLGVESLGSKVRTSLRLQYEAQGVVIRGQLGGLTGIRRRLGLSQRKMCQLLLVDPSAWTRWMKDESKVPPHIWRSLQWYAALQEKIPGLSPEYFLGRDLMQIEARFSQLKNSEIANLEGRISEQSGQYAQALKNLNDSQLRIQTLEKNQRILWVSLFSVVSVVASIAISFLVLF